MGEQAVTPEDLGAASQALTGEAAGTSRSDGFSEKDVRALIADVCLVLLMLFVVPAIFYKTHVEKDLKSTKAKYAAAEAKMKVLEGELAGARGELDEARGVIINLRGKLDNAQGRIDQANSDLDEANKRITILVGKVDDANKKYTKLQGNYDKLLVIIGSLRDTNRDLRDGREGHEKTKENNQWLTILQVLREMEETYREQLGLNLFNASRAAFLAEAFDGGLVNTESRFCTGSTFAHKNLPLNKTEREVLNHMRVWYTYITGHEKVKATGELTTDNTERLREEIRKSLLSLRTQTQNMQTATIDGLYRYFRMNPESLKGSRVYILINRYSSASPTERDMLVGQVQKELYVHIQTILARQKILLLRD